MLDTTSPIGDIVDQLRMDQLPTDELRMLSQNPWLTERIGAGYAELIGRELRAAATDVVNNDYSPGLGVLSQRQSWVSHPELVLAAHCLSRLANILATVSRDGGESPRAVSNMVMKKLPAFSRLVGTAALWNLLEAGIGGLWSDDFGTWAQRCLSNRR